MRKWYIVLFVPILASMLGMSLPANAQKWRNVVRPSLVDPEQMRLDLAGTWRFNTTTDDPSFADPATPTTGTEWKDIQAPQEWAAAGYGSYDGYAWYKRTFTIPADWQGTPLIAVAGYIDDADVSYVNGVAVGQTGNLSPFVSDWYTLRQYPIPANLINFGGLNTIAIRMYDGTGGGGIHKGPIGIFSKAALRTALGLLTQPASPAQTTLALGLLETQRQALTNKNLGAFLATLDADFMHDGRLATRLQTDLQGWFARYSSLRLIDEDPEVRVQGDKLIVDTTRTLLGVRSDNTTEVLLPKLLNYRYLSQTTNGVLEYGNHSRFFEDYFESVALRGRRRLNVYLPPSYFSDPTRRFASVYLLHGFNGHNREWFFRETDKIIDNLINTGQIAETIVVMPDGDNSWYINSYDGTKPYRDHIVQEIVPFIDANYRTRPGRLQRGITGVSMGGFGAFSIGLRHPETFGSIASHMGALNLPPVTACDFTNPLEAVYCNQQIPVNLVATMSTADLQRFQYYFDAGLQDDFAFYTDATRMHEALDAKMVPHTWVLGAGKHDDAFWVPKLNASFQLHMRVAGDTPPVSATPTPLVPTPTTAPTALPGASNRVYLPLVRR